MDNAWIVVLKEYITVYNINIGAKFSIMVTFNQCEQLHIKATSLSTLLQ